MGGLAWTIFLFVPIGIGFYVRRDLHRNPVGYIVLSLVMPVIAWVWVGFFLHEKPEVSRES